MHEHIQQLRQKFGTTEQLAVSQPAERTPEQNTFIQEYSRRVFAERKEQQQRPKIDLYAQTMQYGEALEKLRKLFADMLTAERHVRRNPEFAVKYNGEQKAVLYGLLRYFINDPESPYPLNKGVYLTGPCGTGKTRLMELFQKLTVGTVKEFHIINLTKEIQHGKDHQEYDIIGTLKQGNKCLDEFGFGDDVINDHGNKTRVYDALIYERHLRARYGKITHIISNVPIKDAGKFVDFRNVDRFGEMMTEVVFNGDTMRK